MLSNLICWIFSLWVETILWAASKVFSFNNSYSLVTCCSSSKLVEPNPTDLVCCSIKLEPILVVNTIIQFLNDTVTPWESVSLPSSSICNSILVKFPLAFSNSSNNTTEYGLCLIASVNWPPLSEPTYPGAEPINLDIE